MQKKFNKIHEHLIRATEPWGGVQSAIRGNGVIAPTNATSPSIKAFLARQIVGQQLSKVAANTILHRIEANADIGSNQFWDLSRDFKLSGCGVSKFKQKALNALFEASDIAGLSGDMGQEQICHTLTNVWGIGQWTAEMACIFYFQLDDVWSDGDAALKRAMKQLTNDCDQTAQEVVLSCKPYRSILARHMWNYLDQ